MVNNILRTDADKLFELVRKEQKIRSAEAAKKLDICLEKVIELAEILEEDSLIELHYPPIGEPFFIHKDAKVKKAEKEKKEQKKQKPKSGQIKILGVVLSVVFLLVSISYKNNPRIFESVSPIPLSEYYLDMNTILIIATVFTAILLTIMFMAFRAKKKRLKEGKLNETKKGKEKEGSKSHEKPKKDSKTKGFGFFRKKSKKRGKANKATGKKDKKN